MAWVLNSALVLIGSRAFSYSELKKSMLQSIIIIITANGAKYNEPVLFMRIMVRPPTGTQGRGNGRAAGAIQQVKLHVHLLAKTSNTLMLLCKREVSHAHCQLLYIQCRAPCGQCWLLSLLCSCGLHLCVAWLARAFCSSCCTRSG